MNGSTRRAHDWGGIHGAAALALMALALTGCAGSPKPTVAQLTVQAAADTNPDARKRPSPVAVRVYVLKSLAAFESADFFSLYENDQATLGADLLGKDDMTLRPGESRVLEKTLPAEGGFIAVVAGFREIERAHWRAARPVPPGQTTPMRVQLDAHAVSLSVGR